MKIGPLEGTPEEFNNFFQNYGLNPLEYFEKPEPKLAKKWLVIPSLLLVVFIGLLTFLEETQEKVRLFIFLLGFASSVWLAASIHIRFRSAWAAGAVVLAGILIMLVALGVLQPEQILKHYESSKRAA